MQTKATEIALQCPTAGQRSRCPGNGNTTDSARGSGMPSAAGRYVAPVCGSRDRTRALRGHGEGRNPFPVDVCNDARFPMAAGRLPRLRPRPLKNCLAGSGLLRRGVPAHLTVRAPMLIGTDLVRDNGLVLAVHQGDVEDLCGDLSAAVGPIPGSPYSCNDCRTSFRPRGVRLRSGTRGRIRAGTGSHGTLPGWSGSRAAGLPPSQQKWKNVAQ